MEPGSLVTERKMLLGIKQRAERRLRERGDGIDRRLCDETGVPGTKAPG
jgi:hypothetical protein